MVYTQYQKQTKHWLGPGVFTLCFQAQYTILLIAFIVTYLFVDCFNLCNCIFSGNCILHDKHSTHINKYTCI
jgi:hypothetical protein